MRKFLIIFCALLAYLALSSKSCGSDEKEDATSKEAEHPLSIRYHINRPGQDGGRHLCFQGA